MKAYWEILVKESVGKENFFLLSLGAQGTAEATGL